MKIAVIGATGFVGSRILAEARKRRRSMPPSLATRHELGVAILPGLAPCSAARLGVQHQCEQAERLRLSRQQRYDETPEPDRLFREAAAACFRAQLGRLVPVVTR